MGVSYYLLLTWLLVLPSLNMNTCLGLESLKNDGQALGDRL